jgi:hypothetical protein
VPQLEVVVEILVAEREFRTPVDRPGAQERAPRQIIFDLDATDDPLHGGQEGRFRSTYSADAVCWSPSRSAAMDAAAGAIEEVARVVARIRCWWSRVRIPTQASRREDLMAWCEANGVDFLFGLAKNEQLIAEIHDRTRCGRRQEPTQPAVRSAVLRASPGRRAGPRAGGAGFAERRPIDTNVGGREKIVLWMQITDAGRAALAD